MTDRQPYAITFTHDGVRSEIIRFGLTMQRCLDEFKADKDVQRDWPRMRQLSITHAGAPAEATVRGVLRGGRVFGRRFYYHDPEPRSAHLDDCDGVALY